MKRPSCLMHMCIRIVVHCQLFISFIIFCLLFSSLVQLLCYNDAMISRLQQRVPAKHLRLVQLLRIQLRRVMLQDLVLHDSARQLLSSSSLDVGILLLLLYLLTPFRLSVTFSLTIYLSIYTTTNNKHQAPTSSPTTSDPTVVSILIV
jgi:hypothetical protein